MSADAMLASDDAVGLAARVAAREVSAGELLEAAIARGEAMDPVFNFLAQRCHERARAAAAAFDAVPQGQRPGGPLAGVPFLVKDLGVDIAGVPTWAGSRFMAQVPARNSTFMDLADAAGLMTFGKTTTPELGLTVTTESVATGITRNPWNPGRVAGGSSGGAAVAVAVGVVPLAQASDGGGSVRVPASCCSLPGLKVSRGLIPTGPAHVTAWNGLSGIGPIARSVRDLAAFLDVFAGAEPGSRVQPPRPAAGFAAALRTPLRRLRVAVMRQSGFGVANHADVDQVFEAAVARLSALGHGLAEDRPAIDMPALMAANITNIAACTAADIDARAAALGRSFRADELEPAVANWHRMGHARSAPALQAALGVIEAAGAAMDDFFGRHDILLTPTLACPPVEIGKLSLSNPDVDEFTATYTAFCPFAGLANLTGTPAITLPLGMSADGLPIGVMAQARFGDDALLLQLAAELEATGAFTARWRG
ncbi:amidase [Sandaracinobacteroides saxicola]|uniref:Amidase n=1 Tax=Sandaracinobacteroides saxicola TaxID=2759707 RepID=A0A7G5IK35_9SPHN|nr:amidase [Sandaracinobacteroides saxicola]QMW23727.1 amidase [Sandaracinobacteroides saxicola]